MQLRPATLDDAEILFRWRNDPWTCAMSLSSKPVSWEEHLGYIRTLKEKNILLYIFEDHQKRPVGTANIRNGELSYTIAPEHRGCGWAVLMLNWVRATHGPLLCKIKKINTPSIKAAKASGHVVEIIAAPIPD